MPAEREPSASICTQSPEAFRSRELSWLAFARRVIAMVQDPAVPLLERVKFAGIAGMLHDEFFMKRVSGLKRQIERDSQKVSIDGRTPREEFEACSEELLEQSRVLAELLQDVLHPQLAEAGLPIVDHDKLGGKQRNALREYLKASVLPILTPLAVDSEHPFPFISNLGLNLAVVFGDSKHDRDRFIRIKVPGNRPRWIPLDDGSGFVPLEQVIAANLDLLYPDSKPKRVYCFRVTRGAEGRSNRSQELSDETAEPGSIIRQVSNDLKARRFAGVVRVQIDSHASKRDRKWLAKQLGVSTSDTYVDGTYLGLGDLMAFDPPGREELRFPHHELVSHPRLRSLASSGSEALFDEIAGGDVLLHHPYHSFDSSVLRFIQAGAVDDDVLAIKLTIYRTSSDSPIVRTLIDAARRGKQVAVVVEVTARFDEAPNIAWGKLLEKEGVHVSYGVERLKTHVKAALIVREEAGQIRRYAHLGTGNYHTRTARLYEDIGILTANPDICDDVAAVFNSLTGATASANYRTLLVAPGAMRGRFKALIRREAEHAAAGRPAGIEAKMNQLQDPELIRELYAASRAGVPIELHVRGLSCLRAGVPGLSENIRLFSVVGRFLEHSRVYRFENGGSPEHFIGSADWMKRNLSNRVETVVPILDSRLQGELDQILATYRADNCSAWDLGADGGYVRRTPADGEPRRAAQEVFAERASEDASRPLKVRAVGMGGTPAG
ncbi:hypothetical protein ABI59_10800 [Acidobacteria bacterium Mor1]|nr:hypothetical protein ABI59_10800 [Acidobacteria bacterium Mor1]